MLLLQYGMLHSILQPQRRPKVGAGKNFTCDYPNCSRSYYLKGDLNKHYKLKHESKSYAQTQTSGNIGTPNAKIQASENNGEPNTKIQSSGDNGQNKPTDSISCNADKESWKVPTESHKYDNLQPEVLLQDCLKENLKNETSLNSSLDNSERPDDAANNSQRADDAGINVECEKSREFSPADDDDSDTATISASHDLDQSRGDMSECDQINDLKYQSGGDIWESDLSNQPDVDLNTIDKF